MGKSAKLINFPENRLLTFKDIDNTLIATDPEASNVISIFNNLEIKLLDSAEVEKFKKNKEKKDETTVQKVICWTIRCGCTSSKWGSPLLP